VSENRVQRKIFGPKWEEVTGEWKRIHNVELNDVCPSTNIIRVIKLRRIKWAGHVARMGERRGAYRVLWEYLRKRENLEDLDIDGRSIL
jgi:hypothetical protein